MNDNVTFLREDLFGQYLTTDVQEIEEIQESCLSPQTNHIYIVNSVMYAYIIIFTYILQSI